MIIFSSLIVLAISMRIYVRISLQFALLKIQIKYKSVLISKEKSELSVVKISYI